MLSPNAFTLLRSCKGNPGKTGNGRNKSLEALKHQKLGKCEWNFLFFSVPKNTSVRIWNWWINEFLATKSENFHLKFQPFSFHDCYSARNSGIRRQCKVNDPRLARHVLGLLQDKRNLFIQDPVRVLLFWKVFSIPHIWLRMHSSNSIFWWGPFMSSRNVHFEAHLGAVGQLKVVLHLETAKLWFSHVKVNGLRTLVDHPNRALFEGIDHIALEKMASSWKPGGLCFKVVRLGKALGFDANILAFGKVSKKFFVNLAIF